ncbi:Uncharacterised protein [Serratia marcescens]|nr:Uncharacterised protein [Serratia marcescens]
MTLEKTLLLKSMALSNMLYFLNEFFIILSLR